MLATLVLATVTPGMDKPGTVMAMVTLATGTVRVTPRGGR
jgi:hypothetical protein